MHDVIIESMIRGVIAIVLGFFLISVVKDVYKYIKSKTEQGGGNHSPRPEVSDLVKDMVQVVLGDPKRFVVKGADTDTGETAYSILDKVTGNEFWALVSKRYGHRPYRDYKFSDNIAWMTRSEKRYCIETLRSYYSDRASRLEDLRALRNKRTLSKIYSK